jgi:formate transporter FocA
MTTPEMISIDAPLPPAMAEKAEQLGIKKAQADFWTLAVLGVLAGAFIAMGAIFSTTTTAGLAGIVPYGLVRLVSGLTFSLGLILVIVGGAELFTGNMLVVMAFANRKISLAALLRNWVIVYFANFAGSLATAVIMLLSHQYEFSNGAVGLNMLNIAEAKSSLGFIEAIVLGVLCNALVCLAVWLTYSARSTTDKILAIIPPITAFVAAGFEHSVANMYFIPIGLLVKRWGSTEFFAAIQKAPGDFANLTLKNFLVGNLLPVTIGNIIGGAVMVGLVYWFVYLRKTATR